MASGLRHDIHKGQGVIVFVDFDTRQIATQNFGKNVLIIVRHGQHPD